MDEVIAIGIDRAGGLVQDQDAWVGEYGPGDGDALLLAAGELDSALADLCVVAVRHSTDKLVRVGGLRGGGDLLVGRVELAIFDIHARGAVEQERVLQHHPDLSAKCALPHIFDVEAVDEHPARLGVVEAGNEVHYAGLAGPAAAHERDYLPRFRLDGNLL